MFLGALNTQEKTMFLDMAAHVSKANGIIEKSEQEMIDQYCVEMGIESHDLSTIHSVDDIKEFFLNSSESTKRVITLELLGLGYMDGKFDEFENSVVRDFSIGIGLSEEVYTRLARDIEEYTALLRIIHEHVFG